MTGSPLLRILLVFAGLALIAIPAWRLTSREAPAPPVAVEKTPGARQELTFTFSSPILPSEISVHANNTPVVSLQPETSPASATVLLPLPPEGLDLVIKATWPAHAGHTNALRIQATRGPEPLTDTTLWGDPDLADVVTLPGPPTP